jgi:hypothetical protein
MPEQLLGSQDRKTRERIDRTIVGASFIGSFVAVAFAATDRTKHSSAQEIPSRVIYHAETHNRIPLLNIDFNYERLLFVIQCNSDSDTDSSQEQFVDNGLASISQDCASKYVEVSQKTYDHTWNGEVIFLPSFISK